VQPTRVSREEEGKRAEAIIQQIFATKNCPPTHNEKQMKQLKVVMIVSDAIRGAGRGARQLPAVEE
jgi:hypothetical protein